MCLADFKDYALAYVKKVRKVTAEFYSLIAYHNLDVSTSNSDATLKTCSVKVNGGPVMGFTFFPFTVRPLPESLSPYIIFIVILKTLELGTRGYTISRKSLIGRSRLVRFRKGKGTSAINEKYPRPNHLFRKKVFAQQHNSFAHVCVSL